MKAGGDGPLRDTGLSGGRGCSPYMGALGAPSERCVGPQPRAAARAELTGAGRIGTRGRRAGGPIGSHGEKDARGWHARHGAAGRRPPERSKQWRRRAPPAPPPGPLRGLLRHARTWPYEAQLGRRSAPSSPSMGGDRRRPHDKACAAVFSKKRKRKGRISRGS